jgi:hypothetical protein
MQEDPDFKYVYFADINGQLERASDSPTLAEFAINSIILPRLRWFLENDINNLYAASLEVQSYVYNWGHHLQIIAFNNLQDAGKSLNPNVNFS